MSVLVGKKAPHFNASAVLNGNDIVSDFSLDQYLGKQHVLLFIHPKYFTFFLPSRTSYFSSTN
jgi:peroxiredoxin (alkyl hydroperoxide reductase subunit C)